jgi:hypothetical protein
VEGKVNEPFGPTMQEWEKDASDGKKKRLAYLCGLLGLTHPVPPEVHYQLLHRSASALIEAQRFKADAAVMLIHSFSPEYRWFDAFSLFAALFGAKATVGKLIPVKSIAYPPLYLAWCSGDSKFLVDH